MGDHNCLNCGKPTGGPTNYCSWECHIDLARKEGAIQHTPNNLPIQCITATGYLLEISHGDHKDYVFPVTVEYRGVLPEDLPSYDPSYRPEDHALIYTDGCVALTMYECCYFIWYLRTGGYGNGSLERKDWFLTKESVEKILAFDLKRQLRKGAKDHED